MSDTNSPSFGHNESPDYAVTINAALERDYAELTKGAAELLTEAAALPKSIPDGDESLLNSFTTLIKRMRDTTQRIETFRSTEKEPHLRAGQAVDGFFNRLYEKLARRNSKDNPGASDILQARVGDFLRRKEDAERLIREEAARKAAEEARIVRERAAAEAKAAQEAAERAERARKAENIAAHEKVAAAQEAAAAASRAEAARRDQEAEDARIDALAKPADLARTRTSGGAVATLKEVPFIRIDDASLLNKELLWPHIKEEHLLMALKAWAKTKSNKSPMAGATIKMVKEGAVI